MLELKLTSTEAIVATDEAIEPELFRFPAVDAAELRAVVHDFVAEHER